MPLSNPQPTKLTNNLQALTVKSIKALAPLLDRILVQRVKAESKTAGGIFLPESAVKELNEAKVLAVGPGGFDKDGKRIGVSVKPGDKVLIPQVCLRSGERKMQGQLAAQLLYTGTIAFCSNINRVTCKWR